MSNGGQFTKWTWTLNNYTPEEEQNILESFENGTVSYVIYGKETCPSTGTPHLQGYLEVPKKLRLGGIKRISGFTRCHLAGSRGSPSENKDYCSKGEQSKQEWEEFGTSGPNYGLNAVVVEHGRPSRGQGRRNDLESVRDSIDAGASVDELWSEHFGQMVRYEKAFKRYKHLKSKRDPNVTPEVYVIWGPTGNGKSRFPRVMDPELFSVPDVTLQWWDGYEDQKTILLDDFDGKDCPIARFLRYIDRYDVQVPVKGSFTPLLATRIWISSNTHPDDWFPNEALVKKDAVRRRITKILHLQHPIDFEDPADIERTKILLNLN